MLPSFHKSGNVLENQCLTICVLCVIFYFFVFHLFMQFISAYCLYAMLRLLILQLLEKTNAVIRGSSIGTNTSFGIWSI